MMAGLLEVPENHLWHLLTSALFTAETVQPMAMWLLPALRPCFSLYLTDMLLI